MVPFTEVDRFLAFIGHAGNEQVKEISFRSLRLVVGFMSPSTSVPISGKQQKHERRLLMGGVPKTQFINHSTAKFIAWSCIFLRLPSNFIISILDDVTRQSILVFGNTDEHFKLSFLSKPSTFQRLLQVLYSNQSNLELGSTHQSSPSSFVHIPSFFQFTSDIRVSSSMHVTLSNFRYHVGTPKSNPTSNRKNNQTNQSLSKL
ncbi:hypothetical protein ABKN59_006756 [Abortiporus biennis]